jgi:hypothetical protein
LTPLRTKFGVPRQMCSDRNLDHGTPSNTVIFHRRATRKDFTDGLRDLHSRLYNGPNLIGNSYWQHRSDLIILLREKYSTASKLFHFLVSCFGFGRFYEICTACIYEQPVCHIVAVTFEHSETSPKGYQLSETRIVKEFDPIMAILGQGESLKRKF